MVSATLCLAVSADTTAKSSSTPQSASSVSTTSVSEKSAKKSLKKRQMVDKHNTTWSKIKDLFM